MVAGPCSSVSDVVPSPANGTQLPRLDVSHCLYFFLSACSAVGTPRTRTHSVTGLWGPYLTMFRFRLCQVVDVDKSTVTRPITSTRESTV